jgi:hypothetical protein
MTPLILLVLRRFSLRLALLLAALGCVSLLADLVSAGNDGQVRWVAVACHLAAGICSGSTIVGSLALGWTVAGLHASGQLTVLLAGGRRLLPALACSIVLAGCATALLAAAAGWCGDRLDRQGHGRLALASSPETVAVRLGDDTFLIPRTGLGAHRLAGPPPAHLVPDPPARAWRWLAWPDGSPAGLAAAVVRLLLPVAVLATVAGLCLQLPGARPLQAAPLAIALGLAGSALGSWCGLLSWRGAHLGALLVGAGCAGSALLAWYRLHRCGWRR